MTTQTRLAISLAVGERFTHDLPGESNSATLLVAAPVEQTGTSIPNHAPDALPGSEVEVINIPCQVLDETGGIFQHASDVTVTYTAIQTVEVIVPEEVQPLKVARITIDLALPEGFVITEEIEAALDALADVMLVQAEDGLYAGGYADSEEAEERLADFGPYQGARVDIIEVDDETSASRQYRIDTGLYLTAAESGLGR